MRRRPVQAQFESAISLFKIVEDGKEACASPWSWAALRSSASEKASFKHRVSPTVNKSGKSAVTESAGAVKV